MTEKPGIELRQEARGENISGASGMRKEDLVKEVANVRSTGGGDSRADADDLGGGPGAGKIRHGDSASGSPKFSQEVTSTEDEPEREGRSYVTTHHQVIRQWADDRGGAPRAVEGGDHDHARGRTHPGSEAHVRDGAQALLVAPPIGEAPQASMSVRWHQEIAGCAARHLHDGQQATTWDQARGALQEPRVLALHCDEASWTKNRNYCRSHFIHSGTHSDQLKWASERWAKRNDELREQCMKEAGL
jgi:hypothetical protein